MPSPPAVSPPQLVRLSDVLEQTALSKTAAYAGIRAGTFPKPVQLGERAVGWVQAEIDAWVQARIAARDTEAVA